MVPKTPLTVIAAPLRKQVIELMRTAIIEFQYEPGQRLVEKDLCEQFGVSRTVVREALRHLEAEGLVELVPNTGPIVHRTTVEDARELYELREALESMAARLCAERASPAEKKQLRSALNQVGAAYAKDDLHRQLRAKDHFYTVLCQGARNAMIGAMLKGAQARTQLLRALSLQAPGRVSQSLAELEAIVEAVEDGQPGRAGKLAAQHVRAAATIALSAVAEHGDGAGLTSAHFR